MHRRYLLLILACAILLSAAAGCRRKAAAPAEEPPAVPVSRPVEREVTDYVDFTGRTDAVEAVDVRARVTGYLDRIAFREGTEVQKGDLLFEIDPRPYKAQYDQAVGQVALYEASLKLARTTLERDLAIAAKVAGGVSQQQIDQDRAAVDEAAARVNAYRASVEVYRLNRDFTKVTSAIRGQVSRYYLTPGNLVVQDQTLLTTVVSLDPMYAYFDMDEPTLLRIRRAINEGRIPQPQYGDVPIFLGLQGEGGFPHVGTVNFVNNQVNPTTGSISVRGVVANPRPLDLALRVTTAVGQAAGLRTLWPAGWTAAAAMRRRPLGARILSPGMFVRIRLPIGPPHPALLVIDRAIGSDQGLKFVYVLDADNKAQYRRVTLGPLQENGLRVITDGLKPDDWVVVGALPQVRPRMPVLPQRMAMPTLGPSTAAANGQRQKPPSQ